MNVGDNSRGAVAVKPVFRVRTTMEGASPASDSLGGPSVGRIAPSLKP